MKKESLITRIKNLSVKKKIALAILTTCALVSAGDYIYTKISYEVEKNKVETKNQEIVEEYTGDTITFGEPEEVEEENTILDIIFPKAEGEELIDTNLGNYNFDPNSVNLMTNVNLQEVKFTKIDWEALLERNSDVIGWVVLPDSNINYPILQGEDNSYYLNHDIDGNECVSAAIFQNRRNTYDLSDNINNINGHHMKNDTMFANLENYEDVDYFISHPYLIYYTPNQIYIGEVAFVNVVSGDEAFPIGDVSTDKFISFVERLRTDSLYDTGIEIDENDSLMINNTCYYKTKYASGKQGARIIITVKLTPICYPKEFNWVPDRVVENSEDNNYIYSNGMYFINNNDREKTLTK